MGVTTMTDHLSPSVHINGPAGIGKRPAGHKFKLELQVQQRSFQLVNCPWRSSTPSPKAAAVVDNDLASHNSPYMLCLPFNPRPESIPICSVNSGRGNLENNIFWQNRAARMSPLRLANFVKAVHYLKLRRRQ
jgi:hypothetical protein